MWRKSHDRCAGRARAEKIKIGDGLDESVEMGPLINQAAREKVLRYIEIGRQEGARLRIGGGNSRCRRLRQRLLFPADDLRSGEAQHAHRAGRDLRSGAVDHRSRRASRKPSTVYEWHGRTDLSSSIYTKRRRRAPFRAMRDIEAGITLYQRPDHRRRGASTVRRASKIPATVTAKRARTVYDIFTEWKSIYVDYSGKLQKAQIDNAE